MAFSHAHCAYSDGEDMILTAQDDSFKNKPTVFIFKIPVGDEEKAYNPKTVRGMGKPTPAVAFRTFVPKHSGPNHKINKAIWGPMNETVIACCDDGSIYIWDVSTQEEIKHLKGVHSGPINDLVASPDGTMFLSVSADNNAKLWDATTYDLKKTYQSNRPLNAASMSPIYNHLVIGGGQEAIAAAKTSHEAGRFEIDFYHTVYQDKIGEIPRKNSAVNALAFSPDGKILASGLEEGLICIYHFDEEYHNSAKIASADS